MRYDEIMDETWKPVLGYEGLYEVSSYGKVRSLDRVVAQGGHSIRCRSVVLSQAVLKRGRRAVALCRGGKMATKYVATLVLEAFVGPRPVGMECCHFDDNPSNNHVDNLRWDTHSQNMFDKVRNGHDINTRKTHCSRGHEFNEDNTKIYPYRGYITRRCIPCSRLRASERYYARKAQK